MASKERFVKFVCEQIDTIYSVRYKKMFGEYLIYVNDKPGLLICDDIVYVKILKDLSELLSTSQKGFPYSGAKEHYILDVDNTELINDVIKIVNESNLISKKKK